jgi:hypothetical protein
LTEPLSTDCIWVSVGKAEAPVKFVNTTGVSASPAVVTAGAAYEVVAAPGVKGRFLVLNALPKVGLKLRSVTFALLNPEPAVGFRLVEAHSEAPAVSCESEAVRLADGVATVAPLPEVIFGACAEPATDVGVTVATIEAAEPGVTRTL